MIFVKIKYYQLQIKKVFLTRYSVTALLFSLLRNEKCAASQCVQKGRSAFVTSCIVEKSLIFSLVTLFLRKLHKKILIRRALL